MGETTIVFIGTQGNGPGAGIVAARLDEASGALEPLGLAAEVARPTWLLADPRRPILYAVSEVGNAGDREGEVLSFTVAADGGLRPIGRVASGGGGATHLALDGDGGALFVANFGGGQAALIPVSTDGALGTARPTATHGGSGPHRRQTAPHPHGVTLDPSGRFLLVPDMGADRIYIYRYDRAAGTLTPAEPRFVPAPAGSGPRLILFGADGRFAYLLSELSAELILFGWDAEDGTLSALATTPLDAPGAEGRSAAALTLSADGSRLYASNRTTDAIQVYAIDPETGLLAELQRIASGGGKPWAAELSPSGRWLVVANQASDVVQVFAVGGDGALTATGNTLAVGAPTGIAFASD